MSLTERQQQILQAVVQEYTEHGTPVGSQTIASTYGLNVSPATVRSEMLELEQEGLLAQPHTSAGRIPTDAGYRYFVDQLMKNHVLSKEEQQQMQVELMKLKAHNTRLTKTAGKLLAALSENVVVTGAQTKSEREFHEAGLSKLLRKPEFESDPKRVLEVVEVIDYLDDHIDQLRNTKGSSEVTIYIGGENPCIRTGSQLSMVISEFQTANGEPGVIAMIGPTRMHYEKNVSLVSHLTKLLGSGTLLLLFTFV